MTIRRSAILLMTATLLAYGPVAYAQQGRTNKAAFQATKLGIFQHNYSGVANKSFALGSPGYGIELSTDSGGTFFRYFLKGRIVYSEGKQNFLEIPTNTVFSSNYKYTAFSPELGIALYPVSRRESGLNMYLWAIGIASYNYLDLAVVPTNSKIKTKDQGFGYGYGGGLGFEYVFSGNRATANRGATSKYMLYGEVGFRDETAQLVQASQFEIGGMTVCLGIGF